MKIERLEITNFMKVRSASIDLSGSRLHCFCGPNEAGKSSISEAVRFAFLGDTPRVDLKKNFSQLLTEGERKGTVQIIADGIGITRDVATGKAAVDALANMGPSAIAALRVALGAQAFVDMKPDDRRKMLFDVVGVSLSPEEVGKRLVAKGLATEFVEKQIKPLLKASVDAALATAKDKQKTLRAQWQATTGETFGDQKAAAWTAPAPEAPKGGAKELLKDLDAARNAVAVIEGEVEEAAIAVGERQSQCKRRRELDEKLQRLATFVENKATIEADHKKASEEVAAINDKIATHQEMINRAAAQVRHLECPKCEAMLQLDEDGDLAFADTSQPDFVDVETPADRRAAIAGLQRDLTKAQNDLKTAEGRMDAISRNDELSRALREEQSKLGTENDLADAEKALADLRQKLLIGRETLDDAVAYKRAVDLAAAKTKQAADLFASWQFWTKTADLLEPSGVPGEILSEAMEQVNRRLAASADIAGWKAPFIQDDMSIERVNDVDGGPLMPYSLLSESAKWRVSALIAEVISNMAGMKMLILDRWDVLDMDGRVQFMKWANMLAETDFDSVLTFATLRGKASEKPAVKGFQVHWVEEGVVS